MFNHVFSGKSVWISGHTGFKGSWLTLWLNRLGANVSGFSLDPPTTPSLFEQLHLEKQLHHEIGDVRDLETVRISILRAAPDFVFHLAAQPLVRFSYQSPIETFDTNVMGTAHVLEALRSLEKKCAAVLVTTDKCYENHGNKRPFVESDRLGGHDPYSASKAACELIIASYRDSFFSNSNVQFCSARAGNVIGGGDWAADRLIPDCIRNLQAGLPIKIRNPASIRPWQHVLEPLRGYLQIAQALTCESITNMPTAFNFGPKEDSYKTTQEVVEAVLQHWPGTFEISPQPDAAQEAKMLSLSTGLAKTVLGWNPVWNFDETIYQAIQGYRADENALADVMNQQIDAYTAILMDR